MPIFTLFCKEGATGRGGEWKAIVVKAREPSKQHHHFSTLTLGRPNTIFLGSASFFFPDMVKSGPKNSHWAKMRMCRYMCLPQSHNLIANPRENEERAYACNPQQRCKRCNQ
jgi:hypothetical protein